MPDSNSQTNKAKEHSALSAPLGALTRFVLKCPSLFLFLMIAGAVTAGLYTQENLSFKNRRIDLINPKSEWNQYWLDYTSKFGSEDDLIIVVDGETPEKIIKAVNETAEEIEKNSKLFYSLFYKFDDSALLSKALYFASDEELEDLNLFLKSHEDVFHGNWSTLSIDRILPQTIMPLAADPNQIPPRMASNLRQALERMVFSLENALGSEYHFVSPFPEIDISKRRQSDSLPSGANSQTSASLRSFQSFNTARNASSNAAGLTVTANTSALAPNAVRAADAVTPAAVPTEMTYASSDFTLSEKSEAISALASDPFAPQNYLANYPGNLEWNASQSGSAEMPAIASASSENHFYAASSASYEAPTEHVTPAIYAANAEELPDVYASQVQLAAATSPFDAHPQNSQNVPSIAPAHTALAPAGNGLTANQPVASNPPVAGNQPISSEETVESSLNQMDADLETRLAPTIPTIALGEHDSHVHYTWLNPDRTAIMMVKMVEEENEDFARGTAGIDTLRTILKTIQEKNPGTKMQLTGLPVMENDEMRSSQDSMGIATWLSILGVALLYMFFFRELRHPLMALLALFVGIGWSMAYITFFVGHLNILSISFAVILIGLGIDFGIHFTSRYLQCCAEGDDTYSALVRTSREIGPGILTGCLTTAAAFFMAGLTEFTGIAELGIIAGGGVLCCCAAALTVLPILIFMSDKNRPANKIPVPRDPIRVHVNPKFMFLLSTIVVGTIACGLPKLYYDYNLLNLQPEGLESVELEHRLIEESKQSVWFAISMSDNEEVLRKRIDAFTALPSVDHVEQLVTLIPEENPLVRQIHDVLTKTPSGVNLRPILTKDDARKLYQCLETARQCLMGKPEFLSYFERIEALQKQLLGMKLTDYFTRMTQYQESLAHDLLAKLNALEKISSPEPPTLSDLPKPYVDRMRASDGTFLLKIYGKGDLWDMENLEKFVSEVRSVDAKTTGNPLQTYECSLQMKKGYQDAAVYALGIVFILLMLDLRSLLDTFLAMLPVSLGMICTFGIMGFANIPLNAANMIVLPLILGIGIDDGVHIMHDFHKFYHGGIYRISASTSMSVILTSLTTILSFGTLMLAQHRGLQSLGMVLAIGTTCCWLSSLLVLPAMLNLFFSSQPQPATQFACPVPPSDQPKPFSAYQPKSGFVPHSSPTSQQFQTSPQSYGLQPHLTRESRIQESANQAPMNRESSQSGFSGFAYLAEDEFENLMRRSATCYTRNADGEIVNSTGKAA